MEDDSPAPPAHRHRLWIALAATAVAVPLLVLDNLSADAGDDEGRPPATTRAVVTFVIPPDRPETGPSKGISVVTTSTTSSTVPITAATTSTRP